jgi:hypothetical protein
MKKVYLAIIKNKYLKIGLLLLVGSGIMAIYLNNEGFNCLSKLSENEKGSFDNESKTVEVRWYCFFITNSYVYSLFGILIGAIIVIVWYLKYRNVWQTKLKK